MRAIKPTLTAFVVLSLLFFVFFSGCEENTPAAPELQEISKTIDQTGGTIKWNDVTIEIPANALAGASTFTLSNPPYNPADSLDIDVEIMTSPVYLIIDSPGIQNTIFVTIPAIDTSNAWDVVGFQADGIWHPLSVVEHDGVLTKLAVPPELIYYEQGNGGYLKSNLPLRIFTIVEFILHPRLAEEVTLAELYTGSGQTGQPAIVMIHGLLEDGSRWEGEFVEQLAGLATEMGGSVQALNYPWDEHFMDIAADAVELLKQEFGGSELTLICYSKGGLVGRAIIRLNEAIGAGLNIRKAVFIATPHYGVPLESYEMFLDQIFPKAIGLLIKPIMSCPGVCELDADSYELSVLAGFMNFVNPPSYKCIIGEIGGDWGFDTDGVVPAASADLADPVNTGKRECAVCYATIKSEYSHLELADYHDDTWTHIEEFIAPTSPENLVAYYPFNMSSKDESENDNDGVVHGAALTQDRFGNVLSAYLFDGVDDWIFIADSPDFHFTDRFTISVWVKLRTSAPEYYPYHILEKNGSWMIMQRGWDLYMSFRDSSGNDTYVPWGTVGLTNLSPSVWYHLAMTYDGTLPEGNFKAYSNGELVYTMDCPGKTVFESASNVVISYYEPNPNASGIGYYFDGAVDEIRFYNRALSEAEIERIYLQ